MITIAFAAKNWNVMLPEVFRYMGKQHVEEFMTHGRLRLKCMVEFKNLPSERTRDEQEGNFLARHTDPGGNQLMWIDPTGIGWNAYVLCGSTLANQHSAFGSDCFRIRETSEFAVTIATKIPQFVQGVQGPCIYTDDLAMDSNGGEGAAGFFAADGGFQIGGKRMKDALNHIRQDPRFYFKKRKQYLPDAEYRFVWIVAGNLGPHIDVVCPEAIQFCDRHGG
jgi:hypothetical protein